MKINPIKLPPKCKNCGKSAFDHMAGTGECPRGKKHRVVGYRHYGPAKYQEVT